MSGTRDKAVVLLSGGLDSTTALAIANHQGFQTFAISFNYSQRHSIEIDRAKKVAKALSGERHLILDIDLRSIGGSALTNHIPVPKDREAHQISSGIPVTYVP